MHAVLMSHTSVPGQVIDVPSGAVSHWQSRGWVLAPGSTATRRPTVVATPGAPPTMLISHPSLGASRARIPFTTLPSFYASLGWVAA